MPEGAAVAASVPRGAASVPPTWAARAWATAASGPPAGISVGRADLTSAGRGNSNNWNGRYLGWGAAGLGAAALAGSYYYNNYDNSSYNNCSDPYYGGSSYSGCDYSSYAYSPNYGDGYGYASSGSGYNPYFRRTFWGGSRRFGW